MVHTDYMALVVMIAISVIVAKAMKNSFRNQRSRGRQWKAVQKT